MKTLTPAQRQQLKGLAHSLEPVVLIGNAGLSPAVLKEIDVALKAHELIKVKASGAEREDRVAWLEQICTTLAAQPVQHIGKILVIFRENPQAPEPDRKRTAPARKSAGSKPRAKAPAAGRVSAPARPRSGAKSSGTTRGAAKPAPRGRAGAKPARGGR